MNTFEATMRGCGYKPFTTFWDDFSIADRFGEKAVKDTYDRAFKEWKSNCRYVTELAMVLNHKCWEHYGNHNINMSRLYSDLYDRTADWCLDNLKDKELEYYIKTTD